MCSESLYQIWDATPTAYINRLFAIIKQTVEVTTFIFNIYIDKYYIHLSPEFEFNRMINTKVIHTNISIISQNELRRRVSNSRACPTATAVVVVCIEYGVYLAYCGQQLVGRQRNRLNEMNSQPCKVCNKKFVAPGNHKQKKGVRGWGGHCKFKTNYSNVS